MLATIFAATCFGSCATSGAKFTDLLDCRPGASLLRPLPRGVAARESISCSGAADAGGTHGVNAEKEGGCVVTAIHLLQRLDG
jgi:hypothetical protein